MGGFGQRLGVTAVLFAAGLCSATALKADETRTACGKQQFEAVVDEAAADLRDLNNKNRPAFQEKLRELKDKRKWSHDEFIDKAKPFVLDDKTVVYDQSADELLSAISSMGQEGAASATPDCALMQNLRARMKALVDTQASKWSYMFDKLTAELAK